MVTQEQAKGTFTSHRQCLKGLMSLREKYCEVVSYSLGVGIRRESKLVQIMRGHGSSPVSARLVAMGKLDTLTSLGFCFLISVIRTCPK